LAVIFALWSNIHIQFIDGLVVLGLALAEAFAARLGFGEKPRLRTRWLCAAFAASVLATMVNPFGWHIYRVAYDLAAQPGVLYRISELQSLSFRDFKDFLVLFLALSAATALGWQKRFRVFEFGLLIFAASVSFRSQRDLWVITVVAVSTLASSIAGKVNNPVRIPRMASAVAVLMAALAALSGFRLMHVTSALLEGQVINYLPERAVNEIKAKGYPGPLYNNFDWGGYLIWTLRMPVSIDGRAAFYGDKSIDRSVETWSGQPKWASDPALKSAGIVLGPVSSPLIQLLRLDPHFKLVYEDKLAAVFVPAK
jgi:hypothetical protein